MADFGQPLGVDELLRLSGMAHAYTNERMGRANALRGLTGLRSVGDPSTGIDASLRGLSTARDDEITNAIFADIIAETTTAATGEELPIISQEQFEEKFRKKYPQYVERYLAEGLKLFGAHLKRERGERAEFRTVNQLASERQANTYFNNLREAWDSLPKDKQTQAMFDRLYHQWSSKVAGDNAAEEEFVRLKNMVFGTRADMAARTPAAIEKARVAAEKAEVDLATAKGTDYALGIERMNAIADRYEGETNPNLLAKAKEDVDAGLVGLNLKTEQIENIQKRLDRRLSHLEAPDIPSREKFWRRAIMLADDSGKTDAEARQDKKILEHILRDHYKADFELMGMSPWYMKNINKIVSSAIEALSPDAELKPIRQLHGTGKSQNDRLLINRLPTDEEMESFGDKGIFWFVTINGDEFSIKAQ